MDERGGGEADGVGRPWAGLRQPWQTDADAWGAASKPCWGENTTVVSKPLRPAQCMPAFPAAFEAGHSTGGSGGSLISPPCVWTCLGVHTPIYPCVYVRNVQYSV